MDKSFPVIFSLILVLAVGCTKERPYDQVDIDSTSTEKPTLKSTIDTTSEYLYLPSSLNSTRTTDATFPMYMGDAKIVKLQFSEDSLRVLEVEAEERFEDNPVNHKPVLSIPIAHKDFTCALDADGKCTNKEQIDESKPWAQRSYFAIKPAAMAVQEINFLPVEIANLFYPCYGEVGSEFLGFKSEENAINISVEKTYKSKLACAGNLDSISDLTFRVVYHYSLVKLDSITTPNYKPLSYSRAEETTFGFFDTRTLKLDRDNNATDGKEKVFVNRWAPNKKVNYYLSENFNKPENSGIKEATIKSIGSINKSLRLAGSQIQIELNSYKTGLNPGDLRNNMIVMVEDPVNYGILGYGPTAANPRTGEVVHGRTAMYLGVMKQGIRRAYEELVAEKIHDSADQINAKIIPAKNTSTKFSLAPHLVKFAGPRPKIDVHHYNNMKRAIQQNQKAFQAGEHEHQNHNHKQTGARNSVAHSRLGNIGKPTLPSRQQLQKQAQRIDARRLTLRDVIEKKDDPTIREQLLSTHCFFSDEHFNFQDALEEGITQLITELGARPWLDLSDKEKDYVLNTLLPFVWVPTFIHEVGHNLGLRHNFAASEDTTNYYSRQELDEMGIRREFKYSSVMDYGYSSTNELQLMGKYDIAALRFAYAEKIELKDGSLVSLEEFRTKPGLEIKAYSFCTDEHVAVNPNCNRFDEGSTLVEIMTHWQRMYEDTYQRRNFRNGLRSFSLYDDASHARRIAGLIQNMRNKFERYEFFKKTYGLPDSHKYWEEIEFLKDLKQASLMAGQFLIDVVNTPDTLCALASADQPNQILGLVPIRIFSPFAVSCFDSGNVQTNPAYVVVGEAGKSFQSRKDPYSNNPYLDQIDVRGIWLNKILASQALLARTVGIESYDVHDGNFLEIEELHQPLTDALTALITDEVVTKVPIRTMTNQVLIAEIPVQLFDKVAAQNTHKIAKPISSSVQLLFKIPETGITFQEHLVGLMRKHLGSDEQKSDPGSLYNSTEVLSSVPLGRSLEEFMPVDIGIKRYFINLQSGVATTQAISREVVIIFTELGNAKLREIVSHLAAGKEPTPNASANERLAYMLGADVIEKFLEDRFQDRSFYELMLRAQAAAL